MGSRYVWCLIGLLIFSASAAAQTQYGFRVWFTDKANTPHSFSNPLTFLSQRAIDRRAGFSISIDSTDLPVVPAYIDSVLTLTGGKFHMSSRWLNYMVVLTDDSNDILTLAAKPFVQSTEYIALYSGGLHKPARTNEPTSGTTLKTTGSALYYGDAYGQTNLVNGDFLHDIGWKGQGKIIAVLDEGFEYVNTGTAFDSLVQNNRIVDRYNFAKASTDVYNTGTHGTVSLSVMAGNIPGTFVGTAPDAQYALYITEITASEQKIELDNIMAAAERADSLGADVITISLGYDKFNLPLFSSLTYADIDGKTTIGARALNLATAKGIFCVASAGNEGGGSWNYILTPGDADSAMTVGSVTINRVPAANSGYGPNSAGQVKPDVCMLGQPAYVMAGGPNPYLSSGTSWATPQLAGWVACLMQASGNHTPYEIRTAIQKSAHMYATPGTQLGYGVPNFHYALELLNVKELPKMPDRTNWVVAGPNPFSDQITLRVFGERKSLVEVIVTDALGRQVYTASAEMGVGIQSIVLHMPALAPGVYYMQVSNSTDKATMPVIRR